MPRIIPFFIFFISLFNPHSSKSQLNEQQTGAWYMYFFNSTFKESTWGIQGDVQYRNWNLGGDLEQLLLRGGLTYTPKNAKIKFTLGYGNVQTGEYGPSTTTSVESRVYQEALIPDKIGSRFFLVHRFRYEQRFLTEQNLRTRLRYNLFLNIPLNSSEMKQKTIYLALYNELFINGQRNIGNSRQVELFDRNRTYVALGCVIKAQLKIQLGAMRQLTDNWGKTQLQLSLHHKF